MALLVAATFAGIATLTQEAIAAIGTHDAKISATDNLNNKYEAWYVKDQYSSTGYSFYARRSASTGLITQQRYDANLPCTSAGTPQELTIVYAGSNKWSLAFVDQANKTILKQFLNGGTSIRVGTYGHTLGGNVIIQSEVHSSTAHQLIYRHANPICAVFQ